MVLFVLCVCVCCIVSCKRSACGVCELQRDLRVGVGVGVGGWLVVNIVSCRPSSTRSVDPLWDTNLPFPLPGRRSDGLACTCALELDSTRCSGKCPRFLGFFIICRTSHTELCLFLLFLERRTPNSDRPDEVSIGGNESISIAGKPHSLFSP